MKTIQITDEVHADIKKMSEFYGIPMKDVVDGLLVCHDLCNPGERARAMGVSIPKRPPVKQDGVTVGSYIQQM